MASLLPNKPVWFQDTDGPGSTVIQRYKLLPEKLRPGGFPGACHDGRRQWKHALKS